MGFVKFPSNLDEWAWFNDNNTLAVYIRLMLGAAWKNREYKTVHLNRGQIATTLPQIAEQSNLTVQQVRTILDRLKATGKITVERTSNFSIITLVEYDCDVVSNSQDNRLSTDEQQTFNSPATDLQQSYFINKKTEGQKDRRSESEYTPVRASADNSKPQKQKKTAPDKKHYADFVTLTEEEHSKLVEKYGEAAAKWCIQKLDNYKGSTGKKYASDYSNLTFI